MVILFYKYVFIDYPKQIQKWQKKLCEDLHLKGRVIIAHEGINATLGGSIESINIYKKLMNHHPLFGGIDFKESEGDASCFVRLSIKVKDEIVKLGQDTNLVRAEHGATHLTPEQVDELLKNRPNDLVILDARNNYESAIGVFEGAVTPNIKAFREFPEYVDKHLDLLKDKTVLMYCTGGIRCERASAYVNLKQVAKKTYQLEGGICRYVEKYPNGFFKGKNYIFDGRLALVVNNEILGSCFVCGVKADQYTNCLNAECNRHFIGCVACVEQLDNCCSQVCYGLVATVQVIKRKPLHVVACSQ